MFCRLKVRSYLLAANVAGTLKVAPLQILKFPVVLPHKFLDAEKFNLRFSDASEITEIADKLRWYRYQKGHLLRKMVHSKEYMRVPFIMIQMG